MEISSLVLLVKPDSSCILGMEISSLVLLVRPDSSPAATPQGGGSKIARSSIPEIKENIILQDDPPKPLFARTACFAWLSCSRFGRNSLIFWLQLLRLWEVWPPLCRARACRALPIAEHRQPLMLRQRNCSMFNSTSRCSTQPLIRFRSTAQCSTKRVAVS